MFSSVASFSGAPEIARDPEVSVGATAVIYATAYGLDGAQPEAMFGSRVTNGINWEGHDPAMLIENLRASTLHLWTATGANGPYDRPPTRAAPASSCSRTSRPRSSTTTSSRPTCRATTTTTPTARTPGPTWTRDLQEYVGLMMQDFAHPKTPNAVSYTSIDKRWSQWGWTASFTRAAAQEFSALTFAGPGGFTLQGTGTATVTTPASYQPGEHATVTIGTKTTSARADDRGRLRIVVPLGTATTAVPVRIGTT